MASVSVLLEDTGDPDSKFNALVNSSIVLGGLSPEATQQGCFLNARSFRGIDLGLQASETEELQHITKFPVHF